MHKPSNEDLASFVLTTLETYRNAREEVEQSWLECWAKYLNTPNTESLLKGSILKRVGDVEVEWRHKLTGAKAYEAVETVVGYLMAATFPNRDWFDLEPLEPYVDDNMTLARLIRKHITNKLDECGFKSQYAVFLRQLVITGTSVLALPWRNEEARSYKRTREEGPDGPMYLAEEMLECCYDAPDIQVLDMFDCYVDPYSTDPNNSAFIRKVHKTKGELINLAKAGTYDLDPMDVVEISQGTGYNTSSSRKYLLTSFEGVETRTWSPADTVELIEFWGDYYDSDNGEYIKDCVITLLDDKVIGYEENPYWCGKPFVIGTYSRTGHTPYGFGGIQPILGLLHQLDIITNQRLDNLELNVNGMWTLRADGVLQPNEVYTEPGRVFLVGDHNDLQPLAPQNQMWTVTYQEAGLLEQTIDKSFGTGNYISANQQRSGERVTAAEVAAVRDAGGNRLSTIHKHIEESVLYIFLAKLHSLVQQFTINPVKVRVAGEGADEYNYWELEPTDLNLPVKLRPIGSDNVIERKNYVQSRLEFVQAVAQLPEVMGKLNMDMFLTDLLQHWGFDDPDRYLIKSDPQQTQVTPTPTTGNPIQDALASGSLPNVGMANALQQQMAADGGMTMTNQLTSGTTLAPGIDTDTQQEMIDEQLNAARQQQLTGAGPTG